MPFGKSSRKGASQEASPRFKGWNSEGSAFTSEIEITNPETRFLTRLVKEVRNDYLSPSDAYFLVLREGNSVAKCFRTVVLENWSHYHRFSDWPVVQAMTSAEEFIRSLGGKRPWATDEYAWTAMCDAAEKKYNHESRLVAAGKLDGLLAQIAGVRGA